MGTVWSYSRRAVRRWEDIDLVAAPKPGRSIEVDGVHLHYVEAGEGPPLLLLHGLNGSTFGFRLLAPYLTPHYRTIALDLMGFGYSDRPQHRDYSLGAQARLVDGFLDALGIERASVLGHSLGGAVAMHLALEFPERVDRLILASSASDSETRRGLRSSRLVRPLLPVVAAFTVQNQRFRRMSLRSACYDPAFVTPEIVGGLHGAYTHQGTFARPRLAHGRSPKGRADRPFGDSSADAHPLGRLRPLAATVARPAAIDAGAQLADGR